VYCQWVVQLLTTQLSLYVPLPWARKSSGRHAKRALLTLDDLFEAGAFPGFSFSYIGRNVRVPETAVAAFYEPHIWESTTLSSAFT